MNDWNKFQWFFPWRFLFLQISRTWTNADFFSIGSQGHFQYFFVFEFKKKMIQGNAFQQHTWIRKLWCAYKCVSYTVNSALRDHHELITEFRALPSHGKQCYRSSQFSLAEQRHFCIPDPVLSFQKDAAKSQILPHRCTGIHPESFLIKWFCSENLNCM